MRSSGGWQRPSRRTGRRFLLNSRSFRTTFTQTLWSGTRPPGRLQLWTSQLPSSAQRIGKGRRQVPLVLCPPSPPALEDRHRQGPKRPERHLSPLRRISNDCCRTCRSAHETLGHILNACTPNAGLVRTRHNMVLHRLVRAIRPENKHIFVEQAISPDAVRPDLVVVDETT